MFTCRAKDADVADVADVAETDEFVELAEMTKLMQKDPPNEMEMDEPELVALLEFVTFLPIPPRYYFLFHFSGVMIGVFVDEPTGVAGRARVVFGADKAMNGLCDLETENVMFGATDTDIVANVGCFIYIANSEHSSLIYINIFRK